MNCEEFIRLVDVALLRAELLQKEFDAKSGAYKASQLVIDNLMLLKERIKHDNLPRVTKGEVPLGTGLGLSRAVGEWTEDEELYDSAIKIDRVFGYEW